MRCALLLPLLLLSACGNAPTAQPAAVAAHTGGRGDAARHRETAAGRDGRASHTAVPQASARSAYTGVAEADCKVVDRDEESGSSRSLCPGVDGYRLALLDGDARMSLDVVDPAGQVHPLDLWSLVSTAFSSVGERVEWRYAGDSTSPSALIIRFNASEDPDRPERITSYLAVARLGGGSICVIAKIAPGPDQNMQARGLADHPTHARCLANDP